MSSAILVTILAITTLGLGGVVVWLVVRQRSNTATKPADDQTLEQVMRIMTATQTELARQRETTQTEMARTRQEIQKTLGSNQQQVQTQLAQTNKTIDDRLNKAASLFSDISKGLGTVHEFSRQLSSLRDVFYSPKLRGNIGEEVLRELLEQVLPHSSYATQFKFKEGQVVDAVVKTKQGLIPIDSKFPLENFRALKDATPEQEDSVRKTFERDIKKHIEAIRTKYILPGEGTVDFAVMYVPSEAVYYEIVQRSEVLVDFASEKKVYLVSPNTFYYFLKVIMIGLEGTRMEEVAKQILQLLKTVQRDSASFSEELSVLSRHVTNAKNASERVTGKFDRLTGTLQQADLLEAPQKSSQEKPELEVEVDQGSLKLNADVTEDE